MTVGAQEWAPTKPVRIIVPITGSTNDVLARLIAPKLQEVFGQPFVVENKPGAGGNIGADLVAMPAMLASVDDVWHRINTDLQTLELLGGPVNLGVLINPTRGSLPCGAVQFRGATDAAFTLGRLGIVVNGDNNTAAAERIKNNDADRTSRITGNNTFGMVHIIPWPDPIELVHIARVGQNTTHSVVDTGPVTHSGALVEMLRLTFNESDDIRALLVEEYPTTDYAGASGTGSARLVRVRGVQGTTE
jgi:hypothetical protein